MNGFSLLSDSLWPRSHKATPCGSSTCSYTRLMSYCHSSSYLSARRDALDRRIEESNMTMSMSFNSLQASQDTHSWAIDKTTLDSPSRRHSSTLAVIQTTTPRIMASVDPGRNRINGMIRKASETGKLPDLPSRDRQPLTSDQVVSASCAHMFSESVLKDDLCSKPSHQQKSSRDS
jgi:hypothetical protein